MYMHVEIVNIWQMYWTTLSNTSTTLQEDYLKKMADFLKGAFETKPTEMADSIVTGVL